ncbi:unnamed protein product [Mytilus coruscus]|uniref:Uncharacterized protein n=1 Tax=Mytilus coruscus TaxID=42192 RepID=A0A6J8DGA8_MYTCO|nr:unnamed protein product [Mytilus coruscus]
MHEKVIDKGGDHLTSNTYLCIGRDMPDSEVASKESVKPDRNSDEDVTNADLFSLFKTYTNGNLAGIDRNFDDRTQSSLEGEEGRKISGDRRRGRKLRPRSVSKKRRKLIRIDDKSDGGWNTVQEYPSDDVASNSEDEKRNRAAESRAVRKSSKTEKKQDRKRTTEAKGTKSRFRSGGASVAANNGISDRLLKPHGRWKTENAKGGYIADNIDKRFCKISCWFSDTTAVKLVVGLSDTTAVKLVVGLSDTTAVKLVVGLSDTTAVKLVVGLSDTTAVKLVVGLSDTTAVKLVVGLSDTTAVTLVVGLSDTTAVKLVVGLSDTTAVKLVVGLSDTTAVKLVVGLSDTTAVTLVVGLSVVSSEILVITVNFSNLVFNDLLVLANFGNDH